MKLKAGDFIGLLRETFRQWNEDKVPRLAAALAYYTIFSIAPLLLVVIAVAGAAFGEDAARGQIFDQMRGLVGTQGALAIEDMIANADQQEEAGMLAAVISLVTLAVGASGVFLGLQDALNTIWGVMPRPDTGIRALVRSRLLSFSLVLGVGFLLLVSLVVSAGLSVVDQWLNATFPGGGVILQVVNFVISLGVITLLFAMMFKFLPDVQIAWRDVWIGAGVTALLFTFGKFLIGLYLGNSTVASVYGAAGSLVVLLIWIYYSALILFFGAEFTQVYATKYGSHIEPNAFAVPITPEARARQGMVRQEDVKPLTDLHDALKKR